MSPGLRLGLTILVCVVVFASLWLFSRQVARLAPVWIADEPTRFQLAEIRASRFFLRHEGFLISVSLCVVGAANVVATLRAKTLAGGFR